MKRIHIHSKCGNLIYSYEFHDKDSVNHVREYVINKLFQEIEMNSNYKYYNSSDELDKSDISCEDSSRIITSSYKQDIDSFIQQQKSHDANIEYNNNQIDSPTTIFTINNLKSNLVMLFNGKKINEQVPLNILGDDLQFIFYFKKPFHDFFIDKYIQFVRNTKTEKRVDNIPNTPDSFQDTSAEIKFCIEGKEIDFIEASNELCTKEKNEDDKNKILDNYNTTHKIQKKHIGKQNECIEVNQKEENAIPFNQIDVNDNEKGKNLILVKNLLNNKRMVVEKDKLVQKGSKLFYLTGKSTFNPQTLHRDRNPNANRRFHTINARLFNYNVQRIFTMHISYDFIIKTSMIIALFYSGNSPMAFVLLFICAMTFLSQQKIVNRVINFNNLFGKIFDVVHSFFASMFIMSYDVSIY